MDLGLAPFCLGSAPWPLGIGWSKHGVFPRRNPSERMCVLLELTGSGVGRRRAGALAGRASLQVCIIPRPERWSTSADPDRKQPASVRATRVVWRRGAVAGIVRRLSGSRAARRDRPDGRDQTGCSGPVTAPPTSRPPRRRRPRRQDRRQRPRQSRRRPALDGPVTIGESKREAGADRQEAAAKNAVFSI